MRRSSLLAVAAVLATTCLAPRAVAPYAFAQRAGGGRVGGGSISAGRAPGGHPAGIAHAGPQSSMAPRVTGQGMNGQRQNVRPMQQGNWTSFGFVPTRNGNGQGRQGHNRNRHVGYGYGVVGYPVGGYPYGYLNGGLDLDDNDPNDPNNQAGASNAYGENDAGPVAYNTPYDPSYDGAQDNGYSYAPSYGPVYPAQDTARIPYSPSGFQAETAHTITSDGMSHPRVTLVFKDGRQPLKIQNYAMSQTKVFVRDQGTERDIAISDLDIPATTAANDQAGVDFALPASH